VATIAQAPRQLTSQESDELSQRQVKKHDIAIMLLHWFNAIVWLLELATGLALLTGTLRVMPWWYLRIVQGFFATKAAMLQFHIAMGIAWIVVFAAYGTFGFRTYLQREVLRREISLDAGDWQWLKIRVLRILRLSDEPLPLQGIYNAGQKLFALLVYLMVPIIMITGLVMTFHVGGAAVVGWAAAIHFACVGAVVSGLMIHVYMGALLPEEKPAFFSMITGNVNELYAYNHHFKWWKEVSQCRAQILCEGGEESPPEEPERVRQQ
jgi:formate dehydrogenase subunit gamma